MKLKLKGIKVPKEFEELIEYDKKTAYKDVIGLYSHYSDEFINSYIKWEDSLTDKQKEILREYIYG